MSQPSEEALATTIELARALNEMLATVTGLLARAAATPDMLDAEDIDAVVTASEDTQDRVMKFLMTMSEHAV